MMKRSPLKNSKSKSPQPCPYHSKKQSKSYSNIIIKKKKSKIIQQKNHLNQEHASISEQKKTIPKNYFELQENPYVSKTENKYLMGRNFYNINANEDKDIQPFIYVLPYYKSKFKDNSNLKLPQIYRKRYHQLQNFSNRFQDQNHNFNQNYRKKVKNIGGDYDDQYFNIRQQLYMINRIKQRYGIIQRHRQSAYLSLKSQQSISAKDTIQN